MHRTHFFLPIIALILPFSVFANSQLIRLIGFSTSGQLAYEQTNPDCVCKKDKCTEELAISEGGGEDPCLPKVTIVVDLKIDKTVKSGLLQAAELQKLGIKPQELKFVSFPYEYQDDVLSIELSKDCAEIAN